MLSPQIIDYLNDQVYQDNLNDQHQNLASLQSLTTLIWQHIKSNNMLKNPKDKRFAYLDIPTCHLCHIDPSNYNGQLSKDNEPIITFPTLKKHLKIHIKPIEA